MESLRNLVLKLFYKFLCDQNWIQILSQFEWFFSSFIFLHQTLYYKSLPEKSDASCILIGYYQNYMCTIRVRDRKGIGAGSIAGTERSEPLKSPTPTAGGGSPE